MRPAPRRLPPLVGAAGATAGEKKAESVAVYGEPGLEDAHGKQRDRQCERAVGGWIVEASDKAAARLDKLGSALGPALAEAADAAAARLDLLRARVRAVLDDEPRQQSLLGPCTLGPCCGKRASHKMETPPAAAGPPRRRPSPHYQSRAGSSSAHDDVPPLLAALLRAVGTPEQARRADLAFSRSSARRRRSSRSDDARSALR